MVESALPTVLLADDSQDDVVLLSRALRRAQMRVQLQVMPHGDEAVAYLAGSGPYRDRDTFKLPQLVLLDWKLPRRSGLEVLQWIRSHTVWDTLPVVVLTSSSERHDISQAFAARANSYLQKPAESSALLELIDTTLAYWLQHNLPAASTYHRHHGSA